MSTFACKVRKIQVEPHPNADLLEVGKIDGYQFIVRKGDFQSGDLGVYIPEQAILPTPLIEEMGLTGKLAGPEANRVKAIKLRGILSQGLFYRPSGNLPADWVEGADVTAELGVTKYEPPIPLEMSGQVEVAPEATIFRSYTDIEDIKRYPNILQVGEPVIMTEKLHGSCCITGILNGQPVVSSKGLASRRLVILEAAGNVYWRVAHEAQLFDKLNQFLADNGLNEVLLFGEALGIQDLMYGLKKGTLAYRAFDLYTANGWLSHAEFQEFCRRYAVTAVPTLYEGPFSQEVLTAHTNGPSSLANHIREGVVVRPATEREDLEVGRVVLKSVSEAYLTRKGGTEFN